MPIDNPGAGSDEDVIRWVLNDTLSTGTNQDSLRETRRAGTILEVIVSFVERGQTGTSIFDINKHVPAKPITTQRNATAGVTIYTTQANRPDLDGLTANKTDNAVKQAVVPDITSFLAGDFFSLDVDVAVTQAKHAVIEMYVKYS